MRGHAPKGTLVRYHGSMVSHHGYGTVVQYEPFNGRYVVQSDMGGLLANVRPESLTEVNGDPTENVIKEGN